MALPLEKAVDALWQAIKPAGGVDVSYSQGATTVTATAVPGTTRIDSESVDGIVRTDKVQDFIFKASDLLGLVPARGDTIAWDSRTFEVIQPAGTRQYSYSDQWQKVIRVHTKEINAS